MGVQALGLAAGQRDAVEGAELVIVVARRQVVHGLAVDGPGDLPDVDLARDVAAGIALQIGNVQLAVRTAVRIDVRHPGHAQDVGDAVAARREHGRYRLAERDDVLERERLALAERRAGMAEDAQNKQSACVAEVRCKASAR